MVILYAGPLLRCLQLDEHAWNLLELGHNLTEIEMGSSDDVNEACQLVDHINPTSTHPVRAGTQLVGSKSNGRSQSGGPSRDRGVNPPPSARRICRTLEIIQLARSTGESWANGPSISGWIIVSHGSTPDKPLRPR